VSNIIDPLQAFINKAAKSPVSDADITLYAERINPRPLGKSVILLDVSESMNEYTSRTIKGTQREIKIDVLRKAVDRDVMPNEVILTFSSNCLRIPNFQSIPNPSGSTDLEAGLIVGKTHTPSHTLVVSDGIPDDETAALSVAANYPGIINTLYIGPEDNSDAIAFMKKLARIGRGKSQVCDIRFTEQRKQLKGAIAGLLPSSN